ncbi:hypothetical protein L1887_17593 [Cichorium endivia]|nr:hypothetical protein L1887_17593 [Cichorium endivia]
MRDEGSSMEKRGSGSGIIDAGVWRTGNQESAEIINIGNQDIESSEIRNTGNQAIVADGKIRSTPAIWRILDAQISIDLAGMSLIQWMNFIIAIIVFRIEKFCTTIGYDGEYDR